MNSLLICDNCQEPFDIVPKRKDALPSLAGTAVAPDLHSSRVPLVLRRCGHTLCSICTIEVLDTARQLAV